MNHPEWLGFSRTAVAVAVAAVAGLAAAPALAQNTTSGINGVVTGADGKPSAGASVTIVHVESGSSTTVTTDAAGRYSARGLRAGGPYTVTISKGGQSEKKDGIFLSLAETFAYDAQVGGGTQTITVTGRGVSDKFNRNNMGTGTNLGARELNGLASIQRNLQDYARTDPRISQTDKERGQITAGGQHFRYNSITIDSVTTNDTFGLEDNNLPTKKQPISIDAIQAVQINLSNYDLTQKGYTGANINAVTKSGTNDFRGSVYYVWRDDNLVGKRYNNQNQTYVDAPAFKEDTKGFTLGGPIIKDKLFFFASYEEFSSSKTSPDFGPAGSGSPNVGISTTAVNNAISTANTTWGFDAGSITVPQGVALDVKDTLLKLDWNISDNHRANLRYTKTEQTEPFFPNVSATSLSLSSHWYNQIKATESLVAQWFADWTPNFSTELKFAQRDYASQPFSVNGTRLPAIGLRFSGALPPDAVAGTSGGNRFLNFGTELSRHQNVLSTDTQDAYFAGTLTLGAHEIKAGADYSKNEIYNSFLQNVNGNYTFACENSTATLTYTNPLLAGGITCNTASSALVEAAIVENFQRGRPSSYTVQLPQTGRTLEDAIAIWSYSTVGLFVQDTWRVSKNFNVMGGLRYDQMSVPTKPVANAAASAAIGTPDPVTGRATGGFGRSNTETLDGSSLVQPRIGFNWNLGGDAERRMQLRGGVGLFQGAAANVWLSNPFSNNGTAVATFTCGSITTCATAGAVFNPNPGSQPRLTGVIPAANVDFASSELEQPSVWKANLAFETELPAIPFLGGLVASAEYMHTQTNSAIYYKHLNLGAPTRTGIDGRPLFWAPSGYQANCWSNGNAVTPTGAGCASSTARIRGLANVNFNNVFLAENTDKGYADTVTLSISRPAQQGFGWSLAYTAQRAKEVSPITSSTSGSNWGLRNIFDPNEDALQNSNYLIKDRVNVALTWSKAFWGNNRTSVGLFYEGRKGRPYSWTYINDINGDGQNGNDLMYIPSGPGSGQVTFVGGAAEEARFWAVVDANPALARAKGGVVGRNNQYAPWVNNVDVRLSQELPGFMKDHKVSFTFDILNFGNLLNKKWGRIEEIGFPSNRSFVNYNGVDSAGRYIYSLGTTESAVVRQAANESQWQVQATLRYTF
jgi:Carboxypeptidase regulatory-like domain/TonB dependent receptor